jgi:hypothetical protein
VILQTPDIAKLQGYLDALRRGWTPDADEDFDQAAAMVQRIEADPDGFVRSLSNPQGVGPKVELSDGRLVPRLAHVRYWIWDGSYCGDLNLRWQPGTSALPCTAIVTLATLLYLGSVAMAWPQQRCRI